MAYNIIQVLFLITILLSVYGNDQEDFFSPGLSKRPKVSNHLNPHGLLQTAAHLVHPITNGVNNVVGRLTKPNYYYRPNYYSHEKYPEYGSRNANYLLDAIRNLLRMDEQDPNWPHPYYSTSNEFDDDYYDTQFSEPIDRPEMDDQFLPYYYSAQLKRESDNLDTNAVAVLTESLENALNSELISMPMLSSNDSADLDSEKSPDIIPDEDDVKIYFRNPVPISSSEELTMSNFKNQRTIVEPLLYEQQINYINNDRRSTLTRSISNLQNHRVELNAPVINNHNTRNYISSTADIAQQYSIHVNVNPGSLNPGSNKQNPVSIPINFFNYQLKHTIPDALSIGNAYYFLPMNITSGVTEILLGPNNGLPNGTPAVSAPVSLTPYTGTPDGYDPVVFMLLIRSPGNKNLVNL